MLFDEALHLMKEWDYERNKRSPKEIKISSRYKAHWICKKKHRWVAAVYNRTKQKSPTGCPYCREQRTEIKDSFLSIHPDLCKEWNYSKNQKKPEILPEKSGYKAHWICSKGHEWKTTIYHRVRGNNCPKCYINKKTRILFIDTTNNELLEEYSDENEHDLEQLTQGSQKKAYWICNQCSHEWETRIKDRVHGTGCPNCFNQKRRNKFKNKG